MRLLNTQTLKFKERDDSTRPYAILSHTWQQDEEMTLQDMSSPYEKDKKGYGKIKELCRLAQNHEGKNYEWVWIDTCCIDKTNNTELTESINSMFNWYREADVCFVYLSDFAFDDSSLATGDGRADNGAVVAGPSVQLHAIHDCLWFKRGWTLQELLAPRKVEFYDRDWKLIGSRDQLVSTLAKATSIPRDAILGRRALGSYSVAQRMAWASTRKTTRIEDGAYCLLGLFDVSLPLIYGEGERAFHRLQVEIAKQTTDLTLFAWSVPDNRKLATRLSDMRLELDRYQSLGEGHEMVRKLSDLIAYLSQPKGLVQLPEQGHEQQQAQEQTQEQTREQKELKEQQIKRLNKEIRLHKKQMSKIKQEHLVEKLKMAQLKMEQMMFLLNQKHQQPQTRAESEQAMERLAQFAQHAQEAAQATSDIKDITMLGNAPLLATSPSQFDRCHDLTQYNNEDAAFALTNGGLRITSSLLLVPLSQRIDDNGGCDATRPSDRADATTVASPDGAGGGGDIPNERFRYALAIGRRGGKDTRERKPVAILLKKIGSGLFVRETTLASVHIPPDTKETEPHTIYVVTHENAVVQKVTAADWSKSLESSNRLAQKLAEHYGVSADANDEDLPLVDRQRTIDSDGGIIDWGSDDNDGDDGDGGRGSGSVYGNALVLPPGPLDNLESVTKKLKALYSRRLYPYGLHIPLFNMHSTVFSNLPTAAWDERTGILCAPQSPDHVVVLSCTSYQGPSKEDRLAFGVLFDYRKTVSPPACRLIDRNTTEGRFLMAMALRNDPPLQRTVLLNELPQITELGPKLRLEVPGSKRTYDIEASIEMAAALIGVHMVNMCTFKLQINEADLSRDAAANDQQQHEDGREGGADEHQQTTGAVHHARGSKRGYDDQERADADGRNKRRVAAQQGWNEMAMDGNDVQRL